MDNVLILRLLEVPYGARYEKLASRRNSVGHTGYRLGLLPLENVISMPDVYKSGYQPSIGICASTICGHASGRSIIVQLSN
jgi:hypothetical protein